MANVLTREKQLAAMRLMVEGCSLRSIVRITGIHRTTLQNLLVRLGKGCHEFHDRTLVDLKLDHVECDEIWTFCEKKQGRLSDSEKKNPEIGDQYLFVGQDQDSKLIASYRLGKRTGENTDAFMGDLAARMVLPNVNDPWETKPQISTDGWGAYPAAVESAFASKAKFGVLVKNYQNSEQPGRYGPPTMTDADRRPIRGVMDEKTICTSHVERNNLTIRTFMRRFTRLAMGFSKKWQNLWAAVALHVSYFNFCWRPREKGKSGRLRLTPAMAAGVVKTLWKLDDLYDAVMAD